MQTVLQGQNGAPDLQNKLRSDRNSLPDHCDAVDYRREGEEGKEYLKMLGRKGLLFLILFSPLPSLISF